MEQHDRGPYGITLFLEAILSALRFLPALIPAALIGLFIGFPLLLVSGADEWDPLLAGIVWLAVFLALLPVIVSVLTLIVLPGGYGLTRRELGAREPSVREREELLGALQELTETAPTGTIEPSRWLVIDAIDPNALVVGTTIYVYRGLFRTPYLLPVLAHELGHLKHDDGRLVLALRRLVPPPLSYLSPEEGGCLAGLLKLCGGGFGYSLMTPFWNRYWQKRELLADRFAFECGQADGLIEFLDVYQFFDVAVPFHTFASDHPYVETRIDRLQDYLEEEPLPNLARSEVSMTRSVASPGQRQQAKERKRVSTDAESALDLVFLDEDHVGSRDRKRIVAEKAWIRANGGRIVDLAHSGRVEHGPGLIWIEWLPNSRDQYDDENFGYKHLGFYEGFLNALEKRAVIDPNPAMRAKWQEHIVTKDSKRSVVIMIAAWNTKGRRRYDINQYLVEMQNGGPLPERGEELQVRQ